MSLIVKAYYNPSENGHDEIRRFSVETTNGSGTTYDNLVKKVLASFPYLNGKMFTLYWKDSESDLICFSTDEELQQALPYMQEGVLKIYICIRGDVPPHCSQGPFPPPHCGKGPFPPPYCGQGPVPFCPRGESMYGQPGTTFMPSLAGMTPFPNGPPPFHGHQHGEGFVPPFGPPFLHRGVVCDGCDGHVVGIRYKCETCSDFDLCATCKEKGLHPEHKFTEIQCPRQHFKHMMKQFGWGPGRCGNRKGHKCCQKNSCKRGESPGTESLPQESSKEGCGDAPVSSADEHLFNIGNCVKAMLFPMGIDVEVDVRPREENSAASKNLPSESQMDTNAAASSVPAPSTVEEMVDGEINLGAKSSDAGEWMVVEQEVKFPGETNFTRNADNKVEEAIRKLSSMGFNDEGGWLTALATATEGDVNKALDAMQASKPH